MEQAPLAIASATPRTEVGRNPAIDTLAGAAGGVVSVFLDLIKVRLQTHNSSNVFRVVSDNFKNEGALAFYKVSVQFSVFHSIRHTLETLRSRRLGPAGYQLSHLELYLAGGAAGVVNSVISGPVEHIRIRLQMQPSGTARLYSGPWDCIRKIVRVSGPQGLFRGQNMSIVREFQAFGCYFVTFEGCLRMITAARKQRREELSTWLVASCGALAGIAFWVGCYPLDVVKTKLQSDGFGQQQRYKNAWAAAVQTWKSGRVKAFWRGLSPTLLRTMLSSAGTFAM
ncbi:MC family mitochondrial carrier protein [Rhizodiscina lignyota]|uniref:MC family mitochondrial carrier protein n=1 Tax=Rhizodiscina lignyota TaxID=1504668 RepID=A0A9P4M8X6_9PEZI|nr:MC family mitochondrial carrier protein [Rhizodiscina lignyota]